MLDAAGFAAFTADLQAVVAPEEYSLAGEDIEPRCVDFWNHHRGRAGVLLRPRTTESVSTMVALCAAHAIPVVPQGGNTGVVGGAIPGEGGFDAILSLERMNRIRQLDTENCTMTVEAGCILASIRDMAADAGLLFPLSFGAEGSCHIGGALSTNAGGSNVLKYGNARDLVLGLEVVLADGQVWNGLRRLRKDNTGYDLKGLFLGAEGTLGIITAAVLKLFPRPRSSNTAFIALPEIEAGVGLLNFLRQETGDAISAFELMSDRCARLVMEHRADVKMPLPTGSPWYVLIEWTSIRPEAELNGMLEEALGKALDTGMVIDVALASSIAQQRDMWRFRESIAEAQLANGEVHYFDIAVPVAGIPSFLRRAKQRLLDFHHDVDINAFGHVGDGNIHFNLLQPSGCKAEDFMALKGGYQDVLYTLTAEMEGSISAEHGVGLEKREALVQVKADTEIQLMRSIRKAIAGNVFNPGKVVALEPEGV